MWKLVIGVRTENILLDQYQRHRFVKFLLTYLLMFNKLIRTTFTVLIWNFVSWLLLQSCWTHNSMILFKTIRKCIGVRIVNERVIAISPGKFLNNIWLKESRQSVWYLGPDSEMIIGDEGRRIHLTRISQNKGVYITKDDHWSSHEEKDLLPPFIRILREILIEVLT